MHKTYRFPFMTTPLQGRRIFTVESSKQLNNNAFGMGLSHFSFSYCPPLDSRGEANSYYKVKFYDYLKKLN